MFRSIFLRLNKLNDFISFSIISNENMGGITKIEGVFKTDFIML